MSFLKRMVWSIRLKLQGDVLCKISQLKEWQWLDEEQTIALQQDRLTKLLHYAYDYVPYYRKVIENAGCIDRSKQINLDYFTQIPLLDKSTIRKHFRDLQSDEIHSRDWYYNTSGGSTGEPVRLIQDKHYHEWGQAVKSLDDLWTGYETTMCQVRLWGSERDLLVGRETYKTYLGRWLRNEVWLNSFKMTPAQMRSYVKQINHFRPVQILAYVESIHELARFIEREGLKVYSPRAIMTSAGTLHPHMRESIEKIFKAPVFNRYGSREVGDIACECDHHKGLHVSAPTHYLEILHPDGSPAEPGEVGEIVVTLLTNYSMPLIRYRIGDMGAWAEEPCTCGRCWPVLKEVTGRVTDTFLRKDGTQVYGEYFTHLFYFRDWIKRFQVIQEDYDLIRILIVPYNSGIQDSEFRDKLQVITEKVRLVMGTGCEVKFEFVKDIDPTVSGKYRYTICKIAEWP